LTQPRQLGVCSGLEAANLSGAHRRQEAGTGEVGERLIATVTRGQHPRRDGQRGTRGLQRGRRIGRRDARHDVGLARGRGCRRAAWAPLCAHRHSGNRAGPRRMQPAAARNKTAGDSDSGRQQRWQRLSACTGGKSTHIGRVVTSGAVITATGPKGPKPCAARI
jgi:hypothetical protein